jgi:hypothetical protein
MLHVASALFSFFYGKRKKVFFLHVDDRWKSIDKGKQTNFYYVLSTVEEVGTSLDNNDGLRFIKNSEFAAMVATSIH